MRTFVAVVLLALAGHSAAQVIGFGSCPRVRGVEGFDISRFYGRWYEIARFYSWFEDGQTCVSIDYYPGEQDGGVGYSYNGVTREREMVSGEGEGSYKDSSFYFDYTGK